MRFPKTDAYPYIKAYADDVDVIIGVMWLLAFVRLLPFGERLRGVIPEPFDILNHISNLVLSISISYYVALVVAKLLHASQVNPHRALLVSRLIVLPGVIALNCLFETQTGTEFIGSSSTPDGIDLVYGSIGAVFGVLILRVDSRGKRA